MASWSKTIPLSYHPFFAQFSHLANHLHNINTLAHYTYFETHSECSSFMMGCVDVAGIHTQQLLKTTPSHSFPHHSIKPTFFPLFSLTKHTNEHPPPAHIMIIPMFLIAWCVHGMLPASYLGNPQKDWLNGGVRKDHIKKLFSE